MIGPRLQEHFCSIEKKKKQSYGSLCVTQPGLYFAWLISSLDGTDGISLELKNAWDFATNIYWGVDVVNFVAVYKERIDSRSYCSIGKRCDGEIRQPKGILFNLPSPINTFFLQALVPCYYPDIAFTCQAATLFTEVIVSYVVIGFKLIFFFLSWGQKYII